MSIIIPPKIIQTQSPEYPAFVNAHINNISFPKTIEELEWYINEHGCYNVEDIINECEYGYTIWTVPRNSTIGDIVLYFHAKTAIQWIRKLETATQKLDETKHNKPILIDWLKNARKLYALYGGKIFAVGHITSCPELEEANESCLHWSGRIYAKVENLVLLNNPIDISEFNSFIMISRQSAITPLPSSEYQQLKKIIISKNTNLPEYFLSSKIGNYNFSKINAKNFLELTKEYRTRFLLEANFRSYYVDYFLQALAGKNYYRECQCHTKENPLARVDNIFEYQGKKILLEVKLNILIEKNIETQLDQYIQAEYIYLTNTKDSKIVEFERDFMFVIDMFFLYKYTPDTKELTPVINLNDIKTIENIQTKFNSIIQYCHANKIIKFCDKWITLFTDKNTSSYTLADDISFADACFSFCWKMDCGASFFEQYSCENFDDALLYIQNENDIALLGSLLFSHWRYFNHWAYSVSEILKYKDWFITVLQRIKDLAKGSI